MTDRRGRGGGRVRTRARGQRKERRIIHAINVYDFGVDALAPDPAPAEDLPEDAAPSDPTRDEDLDEGEVDPYLDRFFADSGAPAGPGGAPRAHLAIVDLDGELVALVQGIARPLTRELWPGLLDKARTLRAIGDAIVAHYGEALRTPRAPGTSSPPLLRQAEIVQALGGANPATWRTRVSKIVRDEALELPDGRVLPLHRFVARGAGRPAAAAEWEAAATLLAEHPEWTLSDLALRMVTLMGNRRLADPNPNVRLKVREQYRRRLGYIRAELRNEIETHAGASDAEVAHAFVSARALPASLEAVVVRIVGRMRRGPRARTHRR